MNDKQFNLILQRLSKANCKYKKLLNKAEEEFKKRFGYYPSDIDYDPWIDFYHVGTGSLTVESMSNGIFNVKDFLNRQARKEDEYRGWN